MGTIYRKTLLSDSKMREHIELILRNTLGEDLVGCYQVEIEHRWEEGWDFYIVAAYNNQTTAIENAVDIGRQLRSYIKKYKKTDPLNIEEVLSKLKISFVKVL